MRVNIHVDGIRLLIRSVMVGQAVIQKMCIQNTALGCNYLSREPHTDIMIYKNGVCIETSPGDPRYSKHNLMCAQIIRPNFNYMTNMSVIKQ